MLLTLTIRHGAGMPLERMSAGIAECWRRFLQGQWWRNIRARLGIAGGVRGVESTYGPNGWHPHIHVLILSSADADEWERHRDDIARRWARIVARVLGAEYEPDEIHGVDVRPTDATSYVAKLGFEVAGASKSPAPGHMSPWDIARRVAATKGADAKALELWYEWQDAMHGRRVLTWFGDAKEILGEEPETDTECAQEQPEPTDEVVATFTRGEWVTLVLLKAVPAILAAAETAGGDAVTELARAAIARALERGDWSVLPLVLEGWSPLLNQGFRVRFGRIWVGRKA